MRTGTIPSAGAVVLAVLCAFGPVSCTTGRARREKHISGNPQLSGRIRDAIRDGEIVYGMTGEDVRAAWGTPENIVSEITADGRPVVTWVYYRAYRDYLNEYHVQFSGGRVVGVEFTGAVSVEPPYTEGRGWALPPGAVPIPGDVPNVRRYLSRRQQLGLSDEQVARLDSIRRSYRIEYTQTRNFIELNRTTIENLRRSDDPDRDLIRQKLDDIARLRARLREALREAQQDAYAVLTPEQAALVGEGP